MLSNVSTGSRNVRWWANELSVRTTPENEQTGSFLARMRAALGIIAMVLAINHPLPIPAAQQQSAFPTSPQASKGASGPNDAADVDVRELIVAGYVGVPNYYRSRVHLTQPDGTDLVLKGLGWDGDALRFPIDGGVRAVKWNGRIGFMLDFLHNKAVARLGRGAHGRRLRYPIVEQVEASGKIKGQPAPSRILLTELFERFEFTHGHNMLFITGMMRFANIAPGLRPYAGIGAGLAIPHTEVRLTGGDRANRTSEYQYGGPAAQLLFGLEYQVGKVSYFVEYKFSYAWIHGAITGNTSWKNWDMPGDLLRQLRRWWRGTEPRIGEFQTTLGAHQFVVGAGYRSVSSAQ